MSPDAGAADPELAELEAAMAHDQAQVTVPDQAPTWADLQSGWDVVGDAIYTGAIAGTVLGFLSVYVVLRRMVFVSAAVTQSAGLGVALTFYASIHLGISVDPLWGAVGLSLATAALLASDPRRIGLSREMVLGLLFAATSGAAVLVGSRITQEANDIQSILFGTAVVVSREDMMRLAWSSAGVMLVQIVMFRGFAFASFDPLGARVQGVPVRLLDLLLLLSVGAMVGEVARALGALPAFAMSTLPGVAALALARARLPVTFALAAVIGACAGVGGYLLAFFREFPVGSAQTVTAAVMVVVALAVRLGVRGAGAVAEWARERGRK